MSRAMLIKAVGDLKLPKGARFEVMHSKDLSKPTKFMTWRSGTSEEQYWSLNG